MSKRIWNYFVLFHNLENAFIVPSMKFNYCWLAEVNCQLFLRKKNRNVYFDLYRTLCYSTQDRGVKPTLMGSYFCALDFLFWCMIQYANSAPPADSLRHVEKCIYSYILYMYVTQLLQQSQQYWKSSQKEPYFMFFGLNFSFSIAWPLLKSKAKASSPLTFQSRIFQSSALGYLNSEEFKSKACLSPDYIKQKAD